MNGKIHIEYPESLANSMRLNDKDFVSEMKISSLVKLYEIGKVSSGIAAKALGISRIDFFELLSRYKVAIISEYDLDDLNDEISNA